MRQSLGYICVKTVFTEASLSCFKVKGSCKVGGEVYLNLFPEKRKGAERAHIWYSLWLLLRKQLTSFVFLRLEKKWKQISEEKKSQSSCCRDTWWDAAGVSRRAQPQGKAGLGKSPRLLQLRLPEPQQGQGGAPGESFQGPLGLSSSCCCWQGRRWNYSVERGGKQKVWRDENTEFCFHPTNILRNPFRGMKASPDSSVFMFCRHLQTTEISDNE